MQVQKTPQPHIGAVIIDAGHGGKSPGSSLDTEIDGKKICLSEKDLVLPIAKQLKIELSALYPNKRIILTRKTDAFISLENRTSIAHKNAKKQNTIFVSIHLNASPNLASTGFEIYYYSPPLLDPNKTYSIDDFAKTANSRLLANKIEQSLFSAIGETSKSRGVKQADYYVLKNNLCPAVLIECGFISNPDEALLFIDPVYVKKITLGIMQGIADYISVIENSEGGTSYD